MTQSPENSKSRSLEESEAKFSLIPVSLEDV